MDTRENKGQKFAIDTLLSTVMVNLNTEEVCDEVDNVQNVNPKFQYSIAEHN